MRPTDELVEAAQAGEMAAYAELVRRYERAAIITAHSILGDFHASQDVAQEAFVAAYENLNKLRNAQAFGPWLLRIVRRRALRKKQDCNAVLASSDCVDQIPNRTNDWIEPYGEIVQQFARLPEHERIVMVLRYVDGHSIKQIADATGLPIGTISKQLSRAVRRLRNWLIEVKP